MPSALVRLSVTRALALVHAHLAALSAAEFDEQLLLHCALDLPAEVASVPLADVLAACLAAVRVRETRGAPALSFSCRLDQCT